MALLYNNSFNLNKASVFAVIGLSTKEVMVYGYDHARYRQVAAALEHCMELVLDNQLGFVRASSITKRPLLRISSIEWGSRYTRRFCKMAVTSLALDNYIRVKNHQPIIPLLFCVGSNLPGSRARKSPLGGNPPTVQSLTTKEQGSNELITHSELRRVYKLCTEFMTSNDPSLRELSRIAQTMIRMVTVDEDPQSHEYTVHSVRPTWEEAGWAEAWNDRKVESTPTALMGGWRDMLTERVQWADRIAQIDGIIKDKRTESVTKEVRRMLQTFGNDEVPDFGQFQRYLSNDQEEVERLRTMLGVSRDVATTDFLETQTLAEIYTAATRIE